MKKTFWCGLFLSLVFQTFPISPAVSADPPDKLRISDINGTPDPFSPNGDGRLDVVNITSDLEIQGTGLTSNAILKGELTVNDSSGNQVAHLEVGEQLALDIGKWNENVFSTMWNGKTGSGETVADGVYSCTLDLSLLKGCKGSGDNRDDLHSGQADLLGDCNSGEGNDSIGERVIANAQPMTGEITVDNTPPSITVEGISAGEVTNKDVTITISIVDLHFSSQTILLNDQPFSSGSTLSEEGQYVLSVIAKDSAENVSTKNIGFTIDKTPPAIEIVSPEEGETIADPSPEISVRFSDNLSGVDLSTISLPVDDIDVILDAKISADIITYLPETPLADGAHRVSVSVSDKAGNIYDKYIDFVIKTKKRPFIFPEPGFKATEDDSYIAEGAPQTVDINNDGVLDLVLINFNDGWSDNDYTRLVVMMGIGDGSFGEPICVKEVAGYVYFAINDFNEDGFEDLALINRHNNFYSMRIFINKGDGSFSESDDSYGDKLGPQAFGPILTVDFNQDTHNDVAVLGKYGKIITFLGNGDGTFNNSLETNITGLTYNQLSVSRATSIDLNHDNATDIAVSYGNVLFFLIAKGDGSFNPIMIDESERYINFQAADVDNDGNTDIIFPDRVSQNSEYSFGYSLLLGDGNGGVREKKKSQLGLARMQVNPEYLFLEDVTGDNLVDLVVFYDHYWASSENYIYVLKGNGNGTFEENSPIVVSESIPNYANGSNISIADTDGDGFNDILVVALDTIFALFGEGDGHFYARNAIFTKYLGTKYEIISADFDNDKAPDLAFAGGSGGGIFSTILNKGNDWSDYLFGGNDLYRVGDGPSSVRISDLNEDGRPDIVTTNFLTSDVSILLNNGDGTLGIPNMYTVGDRPVSLDVKDMNGDGHLDIIVASESVSNLTILLGSGDGTFSIQKEFTNSGCYSDHDGIPNSFIVSDYNEDNIQDIIYFGCTANNSTNVYLMLGNGDLNFQTKMIDRQVARHGTNGDFNEDGHFDIFVSQGNSIKLLFGEGDGTFSDNNMRFSDNTYYLWSADFNRDGHMDIVTSNKFYMGNGEGGFEMKDLGEMRSLGLYTKIGDLDGDGYSDLIVDNYSYMDIWLGQSEVSFQKKSSIEYMEIHNNYSSGLMFGNTIDIGDINADLTPDIVFVDGVSLHVLPGSGDGMFPGRADYIDGDLEPGSNVTAADFNGDGNQDIAVGISSGEENGVAVYYGRGDNSFVPGPITYIEEAFYQKDIKVSSKDINNDGKPDILCQSVSSWYYYSDKLNVILNKGDGTFDDPTLYEFENNSELLFEDIDNDGYVDLVNAYGKFVDYQYYYPRFSQSVSLLTGSGDGLFHYKETLPIEDLASDDIFTAVHDLNADGNPDLAVSTNDKVVIFLNDGSGNFSGTPISVEAENLTGQLLADDFDQDGLIDLVVNGFRTLSLLSGNGDGTFKDAVIYETDGSADSAIISEDFNLDGRPDLISEGFTLNLHLNTLPPSSTPPAAPSHLKAESGDGIVYLSWEAGTEGDVEGYNVYRAPVYGGGYEKVNNTLVATPAFTDSSVKNGVEYYYTVSAVNEKGEESSYAFKVIVKPDIPDTTAPLVKITTPLGSQTLFSPSIFVSGTINESEAKVLVNGIAGTVQKDDGTFTAYGIPLDSGENAVTVTAVDAAGNTSSDTITVVYSPPATMKGTIKDEVTGQPIQYTHVRVTDSEKSQDFFSSSADGKYTFVKIVPGLVTITVESYSLTNYEPVTITQTVISGENLVLDIALPLHPATIRGSVYDSHTYDGVGSASVTITDPKKTQTVTANGYGSYEASNVSPYKVTITVSSAGYETYTETRSVSNRWGNYFYFYLNPVPPSTPSGLTATPGKGHVNLSWNANSETNIASYNIYRSTAQGTGYQLIGSAYYDEFSYTDGEVDAGTVYFYVIEAVNTSSQKSGYSAEASAAPEALPVPMELTATAGKELVELSWDSVAESTISGYNIYRSAETGGGYAMIGTVNLWTTSFTDTNVDPGSTYYYVVTAVNDWSRESGWSNEASAVPEEIRVRVSIASPYDEAFSAALTVIVKGTVESVTPEVGVVIEVSGPSEGQVAGYLAEVGGGSFAARIPLFPGAWNVVRAVATLPDGEQAMAAVAVYAGTAEEPVELTALPTSGVISAQTGTFDASFETEVNVAGTVTGYSWDFDGDGVVDQVTSTPEATFGYVTPGIFYPTVTVAVDAGSGGSEPPREREGEPSYTATVVVNVMSVDAVDAILRAKWEGMKGALMQKDFDKAVSLFSDREKGLYEKIFTALAEQMPQIAANFGEIQLISIRNNVANYEFVRDEEWAGQIYPISYEVIFSQDDNGIWKIERF